MLLKNIFRVAAIAASAIVISSCQSSGTPSETGANADTINKEELAQDVQDVVYPLPAPFEVTKMLNDIGASYVVSVLNPANNVDKYFTEKSKAINLGVYSADLAYVTSYNKEQDMKLYLKSVKTLIDALGINIDYSALFTDDFKQKANNKDTLVKIITNTLYETYAFLNQKSNPELSAIMVSGMWVELMYIATNISKDTYNNTQIVNLVAQQKDSYAKLMDLLNLYPQNNDIQGIQNELALLKPAFDKVESGLTEKDYKLILSTITKVRNEMIK